MFEKVVAAGASADAGVAALSAALESRLDEQVLESQPCPFLGHHSLRNCVRRKLKKLMLPTPRAQVSINLPRFGTVEHRSRLNNSLATRNFRSPILLAPAEDFTTHASQAPEGRSAQKAQMGGLRPSNNPPLFFSRLQTPRLQAAFVKRTHVDKTSQNIRKEKSCEITVIRCCMVRKNLNRRLLRHEVVQRGEKQQMKGTCAEIKVILRHERRRCPGPKESFTNLDNIYPANHISRAAPCLDMNGRNRSQRRENSNVRLETPGRKPGHVHVNDSCGYGIAPEVALRCPHPHARVCHSLAGRAFHCKRPVGCPVDARVRQDPNCKRRISATCSRSRRD